MAPSSLPSAPLTSNSWPVQMAQFLPSPSSQSLVQASPFFKKLNRSSSGVWLSSKQAATVTISHIDGSAVLALILQGRVHEEHFVSKLVLTWPKIRHLGGNFVACGRVILATYKRNTADSRQKFAMQFENALQAETFYQTLQHAIAVERGHAGNIHSLEVQQSKLTAQPSALESSICGGHEASKEAQLEVIRTTRPTSYANTLLPTVAPQFKDGGLISFIDKPGTANSNITTSTAGSTSQMQSLLLPPRFPSSAIQATYNSQEKGVLAISSTNAEQTNNVQNLKEQVMACFLDPEFQAFVDKVEKIWHEIEKEMAGEISVIKAFACNELNRSP